MGTFPTSPFPFPPSHLWPGTRFHLSPETSAPGARRGSAPLGVVSVPGVNPGRSTLVAMPPKGTPMMAFEKLDAWKSTQALVLALYDVLPPKAWRNSPHAAHAARLHRSALRAVGRIAFGAGTRNRKMFRRAVERAVGHLSEFAYQLALARSHGVLQPAIADRLSALRGRASFYTWQLLESLLSMGGTKDPDH
jgi:hypothetical protein